MQPGRTLQKKICESYNRTASSADGVRLFAGTGTTNGLIFASTNSGADWVPTSAARISWASIASSTDGTKVVAVATKGLIQISTDGGVSWWNTTSPLKPWISVASSTDGNKLVAAAGGDAESDQIYTWQTAPVLNSSVSINGLLLSWPVLWTGATLLENSNPTSPNWTEVTTELIITNGQNQVLVAPEQSYNFYRLSYP